MLLQEALKMLKEGTDVTRGAWKKEDGYLTFMQGMTHVWKIMLHPNPNAGNYIFSVEDLEATDWLAYKFGGIVALQEPVVEDNLNAV